MQVNFFIGLILDIVYVALLKAFTRRRRPAEDPFGYGPDKYSFPSGHASRSIFILLFFTTLHPLSIIFWPPLTAWAVSVCLSRLLMYRHHILDVSAGILLGMLEALIMAVIWFNKDTTESLMLWFADDRSERVV